MSGKYAQVFDGEWVRPQMRKWGMACCDCGLVHEVTFRVLGKVVEFRARRDQRATGQVRRHLKK